MAKFNAWVDPENDYMVAPRYVQVNEDPQYDTPGTVLIGLGKNWDYQNIVLDEETARAFAAAILAHFDKKEG